VFCMVALGPAKWAIRAFRAIRFDLLTVCLDGAVSGSRASRENPAVVAPRLYPTRRRPGTRPANGNLVATIKTAAKDQSHRKAASSFFGGVRMNSSGTVANGIGRPVRRKEDSRLLTGSGSFADDVHLPGLAHAVIVRSPHAHAHIASVNIEAALGAPGLLAVLTGRDYLEDGLGPIPHNAGLMGAPDVAVRLRGLKPITTRDYPMPPDKVRFVGEPVAIVVAETINQAKDAADLLEVAYEPSPAVVRAADAVKPGAPRLWDDAPDNLCIDIEVGDEATTREAFRRAAHIVRLNTWVQRVTGVPMEPRTTTAEYDATTGHYTLYAGSGRGVAKLRLDLAQVLGVPAEQVRCLCRDMGGNFGTRNFFYAEYALLAWAARRVGRPLKWTCERSEASSAIIRAVT
jgi:carbon-monoxide dehydrogenase large subunit